MFGIATKREFRYLIERLVGLENNLVNTGVLKRCTLQDKILYGLPPGLSPGGDLKDLQRRVRKLEDALIEAGVLDSLESVFIPRGRTLFASTALKNMCKRLTALADHLGLEIERVEDRPKYVCREKPADPEQ